MKIIACTFLILQLFPCFSQSSKDTINVEINLAQLDSNKLHVNLFLPRNNNELKLFRFPKSIPGIYEYLENATLLKDAFSISEEKDTLALIIEKGKASFKISEKHYSHQIVYDVAHSVKLKGVYGGDSFFLKDSIFILNWHHIIGFFDDLDDFAYKITIHKNADLWGAGNLKKETKSDTIDVYYASDYKNLIHHPIVYSVPDTVSFKIQDTRFVVSATGKDDSLSAFRLKELLLPSLKIALSNSWYKPQNYTFIYFSDYYLGAPYLAALEHPSSTIVGYHSALLDNKIVIGSSIHEFLHALYTPLYIRSEVINNFNFAEPKCDEFLWFYEGVVEYLSLKILLLSGGYSYNEFLEELEYANDNQQNIHFSDISRNIYSKKGQKLFDSFYTKGALFAMKLDIELLKLSKGKTDLFSIMTKLQQKYNTNKPFNSGNFIKEFTNASNVDILPFIENHVNKKTKIDLHDIADEIGYKSKIVKDTINIWTFDIKNAYTIVNYPKNCLEIEVKGSIINKELANKKVTIKKVDNEELSWFNESKILNPISDNELRLLVNAGEEDKTITVKPIMKTFVVNKSTWLKNSKYKLPYVKRYWDK